jgi:hypothetical protein
MTLEGKRKKYIVEGTSEENFFILPKNKEIFLLFGSKESNRS